MFGWYEIVGERTDPKESGEVRLNSFYETRKKPFWLITLKLLGVLAMVAVGFVLIVPVVPLPMWQAFCVAGGCILIYVGIAFFVRPEPNMDNLGWMGGMMDDPTHYSDDINRSLWNLHCLLGPGRFIAGTLLDCTTFLGMTAEFTAEQAQEEQMARERAAIERDVERWRGEAAARVQQQRAGLPGGQMELSSTKLLDPDRFDV
jgi:hypothetical protein